MMISVRIFQVDSIEKYILIKNAGDSMWWNTPGKAVHGLQHRDRIQIDNFYQHDTHRTNYDAPAKTTSKSYLTIYSI